MVYFMVNAIVRESDSAAAKFCRCKVHVCNYKHRFAAANVHFVATALYFCSESDQETIMQREIKFAATKLLLVSAAINLPLVSAASNYLSFLQL